jgi:hypothetical protein
MPALIVARKGSARTSVRQAIIALYESDRSREELTRALALDVVATLGAVNGFSLAVACGDPIAAKQLGVELPAGVDLRVQAPGIEQPFALFLASEYAAKGFERIIVAAADTIGLTARILSTTASVLATDSTVLGLTRSDRPYLVGVNQRALARSDDRSVTALSALSSGDDLASVPGRRLEPLSRLSELTNDAEIKDVVEGHSKLLPRTTTKLLELGL